MTLLTAFSGGLWIVLFLTFGGAIAFFIAAKVKKDSAYYVPAILAAAVGIAFTIWMISAK